MAEVGEKNLGQPGKIPSGGADSGLDLTSPADQALARQAVKNWPKRWRGITSDKKEKWVEQLARAGDAAADLVDSPDPQTRLQAVSAMTSVVRTAAAIEGQNQADEHVADKNERLDAGKATENVVHGVKYIEGVGEEAI